MTTARSNATAGAGARLTVLDCEACGACCMEVGHPPFYRFATGAALDPFWASLPQTLRDEVLDHVHSLRETDAGRPCIWLDLETRRCRHYELRPQMCRNFEVDSSGCHSARAREGHGAETRPGQT